MYRTVRYTDSNVSLTLLIWFSYFTLYRLTVVRVYTPTYRAAFCCPHPAPTPRPYPGARYKNGGFRRRPRQTVRDDEDRNGAWGAALSEHAAARGLGVLRFEQLGLVA